MLYDGYDGLRAKVVYQTDKMVEVNSVDNLLLGYKKSKEFLNEVQKWKCTELNISAFIEDIRYCKKYCSIIDDLKAVTKKRYELNTAANFKKGV